MVGRPHALKPARDPDQLLAAIPDVQKLANVSVQILDNIDSSNVSPERWTRWIQILKKNYNQFDGFVMTHGTDTMVYTGSALSFALVKTEKPVVLTGSQRPLVDIRTDARDNLINAVELACVGPAEVSLCFGNDLMRANRATKVSATDYVAFESYNFPTLAHIGVEIEKRWDSRSLKTGKPLWLDVFDSGVFAIKIFPGISGKILMDMVNSPRIHAFVFECFGSGNIPTDDPSVIAAISRARKLKKVVVIASQCSHGSVDLTRYECGVLAQNAGAVSAGDMTSEAAVVKLMHGLGMGFTDNALKKYFLTSICGERSV